MTTSCEDLTTEQVAFQCFLHVHCAMLTLRRCLLEVRHRRSDDGPRTSLGVCQRPATMRKRLDAGRSEYLCDACAKTFGKDAAYSELPGAAVIRRYNVCAASLASLDGVTPHVAVALARALVTALPPCPNATVDRGLLDAGAAQPFMPLDERVAMAVSAVTVFDPLASCPRCASLAQPPVLNALMDLDEFLIRVDADPRFTVTK